MKKLIMKTVILLFSVALLNVSCSKEEEVNSNILENSKITSYLKSFYSQNFNIGKSIETKSIKKNTSINSRTTEFEDIVITEVIVGNDTRARGYVVTRKDDNSFLYFVDVNRVDFKMTTFNVPVNDTKLIDNIDDLDKWISTNEFDLIKVTEDYIVEINSGQERRPFIGTTQSISEAPCGECMCTWTTTTTYVFWINVGSSRELTGTQC